MPCPRPPPACISLPQRRGGRSDRIRSCFYYHVSSSNARARCLLDDSRESRRQLPRVANVPQLAPPPMVTPPRTAILPVPPVHDSNAADEPQERKKGQHERRRTCRLRRVPPRGRARAAACRGPAPESRPTVCSTGQTPSARGRRAARRRTARRAPSGRGAACRARRRRARPPGTSCVQDFGSAPVAYRSRLAAPATVSCASELQEELGAASWYTELPARGRPTAA